jgi:hypothetical protein
MAPSSTANSAKELKASRKLMAKAGKILEDVDNYFALEKQQPRDYPTFEMSEVELGSLLGVGGFGIVFQVGDLLLSQNQSSTSPSTSKDIMPSLGEEKNVLQQPQESVGQKAEDNVHCEGLAHLYGTNHDAHYSVLNARKFMADHVRRVGEARYAIKFLRPELGHFERTRGIVDLAVESKYLSVLWPPNIGELYSCYLHRKSGLEAC